MEGSWETTISFFDENLFLSSSLPLFFPFSLPAPLPPFSFEQNVSSLTLRTGLWIWRIEKFKVVPWPKEEYGNFFSGDSYIVLHVRQPPSLLSSFLTA